MIDTLSDRVHRGARLLDGAVPDWYTMIDVERLDMSMPWLIDGCGCVLANVYSQEQDATDEAGYWIGLDRLCIDKHQAYLYGFDGDTDTSIFVEWPALNDAWRREIAVRSES